MQQSWADTKRSRPPGAEAGEVPEVEGCSLPGVPVLLLLKPGRGRGGLRRRRRPKGSAAEDFSLPLLKEGGERDPALPRGREGAVG